MWCYFIRGIQYYHWVIVRNQRLANINNLGLDSNARSLHKVFELRFYMCVVYISAVTAHNVTPVSYTHLDVYKRQINMSLYLHKSLEVLAIRLGHLIVIVHPVKNQQKMIS